MKRIPLSSRLHNMSLSAEEGRVERRLIELSICTLYPQAKKSLTLSENHMQTHTHTHTHTQHTNPHTHTHTPTRPRLQTRTHQTLFFSPARSLLCVCGRK